MFRRWLLCGSMCLPGAARGIEPLRPTRATELLVGTVRDVGYRVRTAKIVAFNRSALERTFPSLVNRGDEAVCEFLLDSCAFVNSRQIALTGLVNSVIDHDPADERVFHVAPGAGRSADLVVGDRIVNLKGCGNSSWNAGQIAELLELGRMNEARWARDLPYANGLEYFDLATAEYIRHAALEREFDRRANEGSSDLETVEALFLMDYGFDILTNGNPTPAFALGREAHFGRIIDQRIGEIYLDRGMYQATYSGARVDFGGTSTSSEELETYHARAKAVGVHSVNDFIRSEIESINARSVRPRRRSQLEPPVDVAEAVRPKKRERMIAAAAVNLLAWPRRISRRGDSVDVARLKAWLFTLGTEELRAWCGRQSPRTLAGLFNASIGRFKMPLPEEAYLFGLRQNSGVRSSALRAAQLVLDRFPMLRAEVVKRARIELAKDNERPTLRFVRDLIVRLDYFEGYDEFLLAASESAHPSTRELALSQLRQLLDLAIQKRLRLAAEGENDRADCENLLLP